MEQWNSRIEILNSIGHYLECCSVPVDALFINVLMQEHGLVLIMY